MNFDKMSADEVKEYIMSAEPEELSERLNACSFACLKRTYEKFFGFKPVSTMSRSYVQSSFGHYIDNLHRLDVLLGS